MNGLDQVHPVSQKTPTLKRPAVQVNFFDGEDKNVAEKQPDKQKKATVAPQPPIADTTYPEDKPPAAKAATLALLAAIPHIGLDGLVAHCNVLGWHSSESKAPKQKHIKVAISHNLIKIAKTNNWHIIHDAGFFYIFNGAYWVALKDAEVKQLLKSAAIKMGYTEIECRDANFVDRLFQQIVQDGFFVERNYKKQSIINLKNGSLY